MNAAYDFGHASHRFSCPALYVFMRWTGTIPPLPSYDFHIRFLSKTSPLCWNILLLKLYNDKSRHKFINNLLRYDVRRDIVHTTYSIVIHSSYHILHCYTQFVPQLCVQPEDGLQSRNISLMINY